ncbi:DMT family transporter [Larsenimonas suaedae]|uniref:DMT family transporter n=1 Tax=Larsenimonas suaedae TaxID=1851019 RepID=A0ABU1GXL0_9GAMM|nr:DMT family transporter [Larsenimonas suaedae]MCM2971518.1 DMT family transporter [Larsenimonas suaedae]MDR5896774.1 DMT family transporter [Larsenimonas suaedae]
MGYLVFVTCLWAFSFSLIGVYIAGHVDSYFAVLTRIVLASILFVPFLKPRAVPMRLRLGLMAVGAIQLGLMYVSYYQSFLLLSVPEILLFTIFTPIYITLLDDALAKRFTPFHLFTALIAVVGAAVIRFQAPEGGEGFWVGFLMVQAANLCFAIGQVGYRRLMAREQIDVPARTVFGWFYLGALGVAVVAYLILGDKSAPGPEPLQWGVLAWLGLVASGLGYFLWNEGARRVDAGALAIMNNVLIPAGLVVNLVIWNRDADLLRLTLGGAIIVISLVVNEAWEKRRRRHAAGV